MERDRGAHYYAFSREISTSTYTEAFANIRLPPKQASGAAGVNTIPSRNSGAQYANRNAYIAPANASNARIVVKPVSATAVGLYVRFDDVNGNELLTFDQVIPVVERTGSATWKKYYRFASLVQNPESKPDILTDQTYIFSGQFNNLGLYNQGTKRYESWGISTTLIKDAWMMSAPKVSVSHTANSETFTIDHWS